MLSQLSYIPETLNAGLSSAGDSPFMTTRIPRISLRVRIMSAGGDQTLNGLKSEKDKALVVP